MYHDIEQNTDEWFDYKAGAVSGSSVSMIMAHDPNAFGEPAKKLAIDIAVEQIRGKYVRHGYQNEHMKRGHEQEPDALALYEEQMMTLIHNGGYFDNGNTGCSPDAIVVCMDGRHAGLIEVKSVIPSTHYKTLARGAPDTAYKWQYIFNMREADVSWIDCVSYCADFTDDKKLIVHRLFRADFEEELYKIDKRLGKFFNLVEECKTKINS